MVGKIAAIWGGPKQYAAAERMARFHRNLNQQNFLYRRLNRERELTYASACRDKKSYPMTKAENKARFGSKEGRDAYVTKVISVADEKNNALYRELDFTKARAVDYFLAMASGVPEDHEHLFNAHSESYTNEPYFSCHGKNKLFVGFFPAGAMVCRAFPLRRDENGENAYNSLSRMHPIQKARAFALRGSKARFYIDYKKANNSLASNVDDDDMMTHVMASSGYLDWKIDMIPIRHFVWAKNLALVTALSLHLKSVDGYGQKKRIFLPKELWDIIIDMVFEYKGNGGLLGNEEVVLDPLTQVQARYNVFPDYKDFFKPAKRKTVLGKEKKKPKEEFSYGTGQGDLLDTHSFFHDRALNSKTAS